MDAVNVMKGYDKVNHHETHSLPTHKRRLKATVAISAVLLLTLIIGLLLAALIHESSTEGEEEEEEQQQQQLDAVESLKTVCRVTQNPDSCFASLSSSLNISTTKLDPEVILKLSLQVNVKQLANIASSIKSVNDNRPEVALRDCVDQLGEALSRLNDSLSEIEGEKPSLTDRKVNDIQTWVSAAMTDEETCLDGLEEMGSAVADEVKIKMKKSKELLGYSLAMIANIQNLLQKFGLTMY